MDISNEPLISKKSLQNYCIPKDNHGISNYRYKKDKTYIEMEIEEYPEFGTYFCPYENNKNDVRRYFIKFSNYYKNFPSKNSIIKLSYEIKNGETKILYIFRYIFF